MCTSLFGVCSKVWIAVSLAAAAPRPRESGIWFWGCYDGPANCSFIPASVEKEILSDEPIATIIYPGFGYSLGSNGHYSLGGNRIAVNNTAHRLRAKGVRTVPQIDGCANAEDYRAIVFNDTLIERFINDFVAEALTWGWDGYNFDWEFGNFNEQDRIAGAKFLTKFADALSGHGLLVSASMGGIVHGNVDPQYIQDSSAVLVTMGTYDKDFTRFSEDLKAGLTQAGIQHLSVGLSCSTDSWPPPGPTAEDLRQRFAAIEKGDVQRIALFGGNFDFLPQYLPYLRNFVAGSGVPSRPQLGLLNLHV